LIAAGGAFVVVFSSTLFLFAFLPITFLGYYLLPRKCKNCFLLAASLFFYAWGEPKFVFIMLLSITVNWFFGLMAEDYNGRLKGKIIIAMTVIFNCSIFFVYKYLKFAATNIRSFLGITIEVPNFVLPIGISFFTFQAMSYVFDCYRGKGKAQINPFNTALYITMFPQLIAGPIVRYETVAGQITKRRFSPVDIYNGICRFTTGLAKKTLIANTLAVMADSMFNAESYGSLGIVGAWSGAVAYTLQIYFDFSGYSDMAVGLGLMFGFHYDENFNYPYAAETVTDFWRRWHISLGTWFRDYVYFPLGGSRVKTTARLLLNLSVVWILTGIWHGASWNFVFWGFFYFVILTLEKLLKIPQRIKKLKIRHLYRTATLLAVMTGWVFFRAPGLKAGMRYLVSMLIPLKDGAVNIREGVVNSATLLNLRSYWWVILIGIICSLPVAKCPAVAKFTKNRAGLIF
jgi:alginate O-acetyltransferase complex protein AlgI